MAIPPPQPTSTGRRSPSTSPEATFARRLDRFRSEAAALRSRARAVSAGRLAAFFAAAACLAPALVGTDRPRTGWLAAAGALFALFLVLVAWDDRLRRRVCRLGSLGDANRRGLARLDRRFDELPPSPRAEQLLDRSPEPFVRDLGLFGRASLFRLLSTAQTPEGSRTLARWLVEPAPPEEVLRRQEGVRALAARLAFRQELEIRGEDVPSELPMLDAFYAWSEGEPWLARRRWRLWSARALTLLVPGSLAAGLAGLVPWSAFVVLAAGGYVLSAASAEPLHDVFDRATAGGDGLRGYGPLLRCLEMLAPEASPPVLADLHRRLSPEGRSAADWMDRLERLTVLADARRGLVHFFVQVLLLWDFHLVARFEAWQRAAGPAVRGWLRAVGEVEALASLAALAHDQPEWAFPRIGSAGPAPGKAEGSDADPQPVLEGRDLGHPLIPDDRCVGNDVRIGPPGTFLLVTGSNMSGKTTLLRAVGTNAVLAQAGGPVCARALSLPPVRLATSVLVEDSLEQGISFFMAELLRLKAVVDEAEAAAAAPAQDRRVVLYLLDEVLRGTNSAERRVAVRRVLGRLLELGAVGAVTTHDLEILAEGELSDAAVPVHFRESVHPQPGGGAEMTFDFKVRPGLAPTTNALRLLEAVGLTEAER